MKLVFTNKILYRKPSELQEALKNSYTIGKALGYGDILNNGKAREFLIAHKLGHSLSPHIHGPDAYNKDDIPVEYKSTTSKKIKATYGSIRRQETWDETLNYLKYKKIGLYKEHYFARFIGADIVDLYMMSNSNVLNYGIPFLYQQQDSGKSKYMSFTIPELYIKNNATKLL